MGDRLSYCRCGACDIFRCDFDLRYILPTIPSDTSDWLNVWDVTSTGLDGTARLFEIAPGYPGEGLIFRQSLGSFGIPGEVFPKGRQRTIPVYQSHPDVAPFTAFPNFNIFGISFHYEIRNPVESITPGFYRINSSGVAGPFGPPNPVAVIEPPWPTYWRKHFTLHDADGDGEIDLPVDRFPFVLNPGEYLRSKRRMPKGWFAVNAIRAFHQSWMMGDADNEIIIRFANADSTIIGMRQTIVEMDWGGLRNTPIVELDSEDSAITVRPRDAGIASSAATNLGRRGYWWIFRDNTIDLSESFDGTESIDVFASSAGSTIVTSGASLVPENERSRGVINVDPESETIGLTKIILSVAIQSQKLGTITAGRINGTPAESASINPECETRHICPIIYPHTHVKWILEELTIPGMIVPEAKTYISVQCNRVCDLHANPLDLPIGSFEFPTYHFGQGLYFFSPGRTAKNLISDTGEIPAGIGYSFNDGSPLHRSGGKIRVLIDQPVETAPQVRVRVWLDTQYPFSAILNENLGEPIPWGGSWSNLLDNPLGYLGRPLIVDNSDYSFEAVPELESGGVEHGWLTIRGQVATVGNTLLMMYWERLVDRWDGPLPPMTFTGQEFNFDSPFAMHANSSDLTYTQSRYIAVATSARQTISGYDGLVPLITTDATFDTIDLADLVLRIGPPS